MRKRKGAHKLTEADGSLYYQGRLVGPMPAPHIGSDGEPHYFVNCMAASRFRSQLEAAIGAHDRVYLEQMYRCLHCNVGRSAAVRRRVRPSALARRAPAMLASDAPG